MANLREVLGAVGLAVVAVALSGWLVWEYRLRTSAQGADPVVVTACRAAYERARSLADTAIVDAQRHVVSRDQAPNARSCGQLRREGTLSRPLVR